jgi:hypothetical protein
MEPKQEPLGPPELPRGTKPVIPAATGQAEAPTSAGQPQAYMPPEPETTVPDEPDELNQHVVDPGDPDGLVAAEEKRKWDAAHPPKPAAAATPRRKKHRWPIVLFIFILIAAAAVGAYWFGSRQASKDQPATQAKTTKQTPATTPKAAQQKAASVPTKHYDSATYTLGLDYPQTWTLSDTAAKLTVVSPTVPLTTAKGSVNGHVVVTLQNKQATIAGYPQSGAVASLESKKLTYKQPTSIQRAQTYLSYLGYTGQSGLDALYVTGDNGYQAGQTVPMSDVVPGDPLISVTFESCTSDDCSTGTPTMLTLQASSWQSNAANAQVETLLKSIQLD